MQSTADPLDQLSPEQRAEVEKRRNNDFLYTLVTTEDTQYRKNAYLNLVKTIRQTLPQLPKSTARNLESYADNRYYTLLIIMYALVAIPEFYAYVQSKSWWNVPVLRTDCESLLMQFLTGEPTPLDPTSPSIPLTLRQVVDHFVLLVKSRFDPYGMCTIYNVQKLTSERRTQ